jgi:LytS/YehU family sensor histidine kinase
MPFLVLSSVILCKLSPDSIPDMLTFQAFLRWLMLVFLTLFCSILGALYRFSIDWFDNLHLKKELLQSELTILKSKLNPHFLFNTLNNIDTLVQSAPEKASEAITQLSDLLRYVVYETANEKTTIQEEIRIVQKYMDLERLRISNPDLVSFENSITNDYPVPPMLFIPFIENAFKHSNLNHPNQRITVSFSDNNNEIVFHCQNTIGAQKSKAKEQGIGLDLVRKRLTLTYPGKHSLHIKQHNDEYIVLLKISISDD